jgi:hypothetical protein
LDFSVKMISAAFCQELAASSGSQRPSQVKKAS